MKIYIFSLFIFILLYNSHAQEVKWQTYDLDSIVYLDMPNQVYETDSIIDYKKYYQISSTDNSSLFIAQKHYLSQLFSNVEVEKLPSNEKQLKEYYLDIIWSFDEVSEFTMDDYKAIELNGFNAFEVYFVNKNDTLVQKLVLILVNKNLYFFSIINENGYDISDVARFFNSIQFEDDIKINQYPSPSYFSVKNTFIFLSVFLGISFLLRIKSKKRG